MPFLRNTWYVAAWANEVAPGKIFARTLLDEPIAMYRGPDGHPHALADRCPHRFAPLSMGRLCDEGRSLQCGYHGLRFDGSGQCVLNPHGDGRIPKTAVVRSYPVVERHSVLWIWMGDPERADPDLITNFDCLDPEGWAVSTGYLNVKGHYELESDNILDLSHIEFLHPLFSSDAVSRGKIEVAQEGDTLWSKRFMSDDRNAPDFICEAFGVPPGTTIDRWLEVRWNAPALMLLWIGGVAAGRPRTEGVIEPSVHFFTPETASSTHYFYASPFSRSLGAQAETMTQLRLQQTRGVFEEEDKPIIEAVARRMDGAGFWSLKPVVLSGDGAAVRARRAMERLIAQEQASLAESTR